MREEHALTPFAVTRSLGNGVYLHYAKNDRFKSNAFSVNYFFPQTRGLAAADCILPRLLRRGCLSYPSERALAARLDDLFGTELTSYSERIAEMRLTGFTVSFLSERYLPQGEAGLTERVLSLLFSVTDAPLLAGEGFLPEKVKRECEAHLDALRSVKNRKERYAAHLARELMREARCYDPPAGGTEEETLRITPVSLFARYREMLDRSEIHYVYVGDMEEEALIALLPKRKECTPSPRRALTRSRREAKRVKRRSCRTDGTQSILVLGCRTGVFAGEEAVPAATLLLEILSESPMAKLFVHVREERHLCYSVRAAMDLSAGTMQIMAGIEREKRAEAERAILAELAECAAGGITEQELACAKESLRSAYLSIHDDPGAMESYLSHQAIRGADPSPEARVAKIDALTVRDIAEVAAGMTLDTVFFLQAEGSDVPNV